MSANTIDSENNATQGPETAPAKGRRKLAKKTNEAKKPNERAGQAKKGARQIESRLGLARSLRESP